MAYSAPPRYVGSKVVVHVGRLWLRIMDSQTLACPREHTIALQKGTFSVSKPIRGNRIQNRR
ncbi:MAG: hypothetical protein WBE30_16370 [Candidatus Cybelea sp.]